MDYTHKRKKAPEDFPERLAAWRRRVGDQGIAADALQIRRDYLSKLENRRAKASWWLYQRFLLLESAPIASVLSEVDEHSARVKEEAQAANYARAKAQVKDEARVMKVRRIPLMGWAQAGTAVDFEDVVDWEAFVTTEIDDPKAIAVRVRGDSMAPRIEEGSIAVVCPSDEPRNEGLVIARLRNEGVLLKKLQMVDQQRTVFRLISFNPQYAPMERTVEQFLWIYPVRQIITLY